MKTFMFRRFRNDNWQFRHFNKKKIYQLEMDGDIVSVGLTKWKIGLNLKLKVITMA